MIADASSSDSKPNRRPKRPRGAFAQGILELFEEARRRDESRRKLGTGMSGKGDGSIVVGPGVLVRTGAGEGTDIAAAREAWLAGPNAAMAYMAATHPFARAQVVPPIHARRLPLRGVDHAVQTHQGLNRVVVCEGEPPSVLVPGSKDEGTVRLAAWLEVQVLADMRRHTDLFCSRLGLERAHIGLMDDPRYWGLCYTTQGRILYSWRLILAPPYVAEYLAAHEVVHLIQSGHGSDFWKLVKCLCLDTKAAERWLNLNYQRVFRFGSS